MPEADHPSNTSAGTRVTPPAFRPLAGVHVLMKALPRDVLEACKTTPEGFSLRLMSGLLDKAWLGVAKTPEQLTARLATPNIVCATDIPIHLDVSYEELAVWQLDPKISLLAYYPERAVDLPNVLYALGYFGAIVVDFKLYQDDPLSAIAGLQALGTALGEVVAVLPHTAYPAFADAGIDGPTADPARSVQVRLLGPLPLIFGREAIAPDQRFAADNDTAAWCEALDYASLSPRLELKTRHDRVGGLRQAAMGMHYRLVNSSRLYRRIANRVAVTDSALDALMLRARNDLEYFSWRFGRSSKRKLHAPRGAPNSRASSLPARAP